LACGPGAEAPLTPYSDSGQRALASRSIVGLDPSPLRVLLEKVEGS
jgi:hypothetical protein